MDLSKLKEPFNLATDIKFRIGSVTQDKTKGMALAYLENRAIMDRLDDVCGQENWRNEFVKWKDSAVLCGISIKINDEWVTKWDGADETNFEPTKGGLSDSMKRAAVQWGMGRYLYNLPAPWVALKDGKYIADKQEPYRKIQSAYPAESIGNLEVEQDIPPTKKSYPKAKTKKAELEHNVSSIKAAGEHFKSIGEIEAYNDLLKDYELDKVTLEESQELLTAVQKLYRVMRKESK